ncbi:SAM-dependent chlorinase/fluorinase [Persephonella atlantica]|uniref:SAM-dependent chlorinase/fluorinase n=1 Tax=Persephonella atlantica TaxID=2699429 RepID=A0ABS1GHK4_9AQUI|nr:S-adenosyl-l-methionine hydroxide adenosyltransferase family protein [Persephonella atlantica]MBK3332414.1 SAM-dependent chlorinase/fluorinase [Persephonella atlantica]
MSVIALLTDFGYKDGFVGAVKGVIKSINKDAEVVDISHGIASFNILEGALVLNAVYRYFPEKTIFMCVVDPGVGTNRRPILIETERYFFVAPDNGLLSIALKNEKIKGIYHLSNENYFLKRDTDTFHGRDIFAPVSAYLSIGVNPGELGSEIEGYVELPFPEPVMEDGFLKGKIVMFDKFGNGITNIPQLPDRFSQIIVKDLKIKKICRNFLEGEENSLNLIKGSFGFYEIFVPQKSAKDMFNLNIGDEIKIKLE